MRTLGKDKSTPKRGQRNTHRAIFGSVGEWLAVTHKWKWDDENYVRTFILDDGEKMHIMMVYTYEIEAVFAAMKSTWSFSKHLGTRLLYDAIFLTPKMRVWHHGLVRPHIVEAQIAGITEEHAERLPKAKSPWVVTSGGNQIKQPDAPAPVSTFRL